jgi:copper transport protein
MLRAEKGLSVTVMQRFSRAILPVLLALIAAGGVLAIIQLGSVEALWTTRYGKILALKLIAVLGLLALAVVNRLVFTPAVARGGRQMSRRFAQAVGAEVVLVFVIFGLAAGWRFTPPPRAIAAAHPAKPAYTHIHTASGMAEVTLHPGRVGKSTGTLVLLSGSGEPLEAKAVTLSLSNRAAGIEPLERPARRVTAGKWSVENLSIPVPGRWQVRVDALVTDFDKLMLDGSIEIRP